MESAGTAAQVAFLGKSTQYRHMGKRGRLLFMVAAITLLVVLMWRALPPPEPAYKGKSLSYWLVQRTDSDKQVERDAAAVAIRAIGTNAIPTLLQMMREKESPFKSRWLARRWYHFFSVIYFSEPAGILERAEEGFDVLGPSAASAVPELSKILDDNLSSECSSRTANALGNIGPDAGAAVPSLLRAALKTNGTAHFEAFGALGKIHANPDSVVPVLLWVVSNTPADRMYAIDALGQYRGDAKTAVPALVALLNDPNVKSISPYGKGFVSDRSQVERALHQIDPETYARVVTNGPANTNKDL